MARYAPHPPWLRRISLAGSRNPLEPQQADPYAPWHVIMLRAPSQICNAVRTSPPPAPYRSQGRAVAPTGAFFLSATHVGIRFDSGVCSAVGGWLATLPIPLGVCRTLSQAPAMGRRHSWQTPTLRACSTCYARKTPGRGSMARATPCALLPPLPLRLVTLCA